MDLVLGNQGASQAESFLNQSESFRAAQVGRTEETQRGVGRIGEAQRGVGRIGKAQRGVGRIGKAQRGVGRIGDARYGSAGKEKQRNSRLDGNKVGLIRKKGRQKLQLGRLGQGRYCATKMCCYLAKSKDLSKN